MLFRVRLGGEEAYLVVLLEFQSRADRFMALRLLLYQCQVWMSLVERARQQKRPLRWLPPVFPVVLYSGEAVWSMPLRLEELVAGWTGGVEEASAAFAGLRAYVPRYSYRVIDQGRFEPEVLREAGNLISALFWIQNVEEGKVEEALAEIPPWLWSAKQVSPAAVDRFLDWLQVRFHEENRRPGELRARELGTLDEVNTMLDAAIKSWRAKLLAEGQAVGKAEGRAEGEREASLRTAQKLLEQGMAPEQVAEIVELPVEEVRALLS